MQLYTACQIIGSYFSKDWTACQILEGTIKLPNILYIYQIFFLKMPNCPVVVQSYNLQWYFVCVRGLSWTWKKGGGVLQSSPLSWKSWIKLYCTRPKEYVTWQYTTFVDLTTLLPQFVGSYTSQIAFIYDNETLRHNKLYKPCKLLRVGPFKKQSTSLFIFALQVHLNGLPLNLHRWIYEVELNVGVSHFKS